MWGQSWVTPCHSFPLLDYIVHLSHTRDSLMVSFAFVLLLVFLYLGCACMCLFVCCLSVADRHLRGPSKRKWCVYDSATPFSFRDIFLCAFLSDPLFPGLAVLPFLLYHSFPFPSLSQDPRNDSKSQGTGNDYRLSELCFRSELIQCHQNTLARFNYSPSFSKLL